ncbi:MAG: ABC transporter ATP-binding protein, partial [Bdellovibrionales bacterium]|nr:ABC transporter ATP-binding protein [Bdellovibrionales bacterium]
MTNLIEVKNLKTRFRTDDGSFFAVDDISFSVPAGKTLGIVGESGCGKSVTSLSIMRLIPSPPGEIVSGQIVFDGEDLLKISEEKMRTIRGNQISMIFQEPMTSLNPVFTIGDQIAETIELHQKGLNKDQIRKKTVEMLELVGIPAPNKRVDDYPHQLSCGMRQRVMIAMALYCNPRLLIAD